MLFCLESEQMDLLARLIYVAGLVLTGNNARRPEGSREADFDAPPTQFHTIMKRLFPVLLSLACAAESVARQLFEPLVMSLVHWLTRSARRYYSIAAFQFQIVGFRV